MATLSHEKSVSAGTSRTRWVAQGNDKTNGLRNDVSLQRVKKGFKQTADLKHVCADSNKGRKVIQGSVTYNGN